MGKLKLTKKAVKEAYGTIIKIGYCNLQWLLKYENPFAYSTRAEGWACDYYNIDNVIISMGYSPIGKGVSYELTKKYEDKAREIATNYKLNWEQQKNQLSELLNQFIEECVK